MAHYLDGSLKSARRILGVHIKGHSGRQAKCVGGKLRGSKPGSRSAARAALASAARSCGHGGG
jgi:hypothetical protein